MVNISKILVDGGSLSLIATIMILFIMKINPRIFLHDYPKEIQAVAAPKTTEEKRLSLVLGIPFLLALLLVPFVSTLALNTESAPFYVLFVNAFGVSMVFNIVDWLILDWLVFCTLTPRFLVIPGMEGMAAYKDYGFHFRGFLAGCVFSIFAGLVIAGIVFILK